MRLRWKRWSLVLAVPLILMALAAVYAGWTWQQWRAENGIVELHWERTDWQSDSLTLHALTLKQRQPARTVSARIDRLHVSWSWGGILPQWQSMTLGASDIKIEPVGEGRVPAIDADTQPASAHDMLTLFQRLGAWLPRSLALEHFTARLPCKTGICNVAGSLALSRPMETPLPLQVHLRLLRQDHRLELLGDLKEQDDGLRLDARVLLNGQPEAFLETGLKGVQQTEPLQWRGKLEIPSLPPTQWMLQWLREWTAIPANPLNDQPKQARVNLQWEARFEAGTDWQLSEARLQGEASLPQPWPIPGLGAVAGDIHGVLAGQDGGWWVEDFTSDLRLSSPDEWLNRMPEAVRPGSFRLQVRHRASEGKGGAVAGPLPLDVRLSGKGKASFTLDTAVTLHRQVPWRVTFNSGRLQASVPGYDWQGWQARTLSATLAFTGDMDGNGGRVRLGNPSGLQVERVSQASEAEALALESLKADLAGWRMAFSTDEGNSPFAVSGPLTLKAGAVRHPLLNPSPWRLRGPFEAMPDRIEFDGLMDVASLEAPLRVLWNPADGLAVDHRLKLEAADDDAMASLLKSWPKGLTLDAGSLSLNARLKVSPGQSPGLSAELLAQDVSGLYDRTAFSELTAVVDLSLDDELTVDVPQAFVETVNPGLPVGPVTAKLSYRAQREHPMAGEVQVNQAEASFLDGRVWVDPGTWTLGQWPLTVPLQLRGISLKRLLTLYPAEGVGGTGQLSGSLPVLIGPDGIEVRKGQVAAESPGGRLKLPSDRIRAMGSGNQALTMVAQAVEDFHYSVLSSQVSYDQEGTLLLDLALKGRNPDFRKGQPVHLNINLEEDIPALLTSLQLSGRVNDTVTKRVKEQLEKGQFNE